MKRTNTPLSMLAVGLLALGLTQGALADGHVTELLWEREGADFPAYDSILIRDLDLSDVKVLKPVWEQDDPEPWTLEGNGGEAIQNLFRDIMTEELSRNDGFTIVDEGGPGVLQLEVEFLSITPYVKPGTTSNPGTGFEISTLGSGDVHISAELRDGDTGAVLTLIEGERQIGTEYKELSVENHRANLEKTFRNWGQRLREYIVVKQAL